MQPQFLAKLSHSSAFLINYLPPKLAIQIYSRGRSYFMRKLYEHNIEPLNLNYHKWQQTLWGINFRLPLLNAAGMFKNGEGYDLVASQGAGGYIGGTSTFNPRLGNICDGIKHPFITLPKTSIAINYLGLPNLGDQILSDKQITKHKIPGCPIGWSIMRSPDYLETEALDKLIESLWLYHDNPIIDFIEINESCPNIKIDSTGISSRLNYYATNFLKKRKRNLPVILKLSNDFDVEDLPKLLDLVFECKFDGINFGNTSTEYMKAYPKIKNTYEKRLFDYFTKNYKGGISGEVLKNRSLNLCKNVVNYREKVNPGYEFHIIRTGGINSLEDVVISRDSGISLNQWYSGYFQNYIKLGDNLYQNIFNLC